MTDADLTGREGSPERRTAMRKVPSVALPVHLRGRAPNSREEARQPIATSLRVTSFRCAAVEKEATAYLELEATM